MDTALPWVTLVTPSFQQARFIRDCVESVLKQDYPNLEYLVFDGGSTDGTTEILRSFGNRFWWQSKPDDGQAAAVNAGLRRARGEIVGFLNSDDWLEAGAVAAAVRALQGRSDVDVVYGQTTITDAKGTELRSFPTQAFNREVFIQHCFISQPAAFWRRSLHQQFGYFSSHFDHTLDYEFWLRLMCGGVGFLHVPEKWAYARDHVDAKSYTKRGEIFRQIRDMQVHHLGYCGRNWWEQYLRFLRDERGGVWGALPGGKNERLYGLAWLPYVLWRRKLGGALLYRPGHWRA